MNGFEVDILTKDSNKNAQVFILKGEFKTLDAIQFKEKLLNTLVNPAVSDLEINLEAVNEMDITALNSLIVAKRKANKLNKTFVVKSEKTHEIHKLLKTTLFDSFLDVETLS